MNKEQALDRLWELDKETMMEAIISCWFDFDYEKKTWEVK